MSDGLGEDNMTGKKMFYKVLGNTGLHVSVLSYGFWATYGIKDGLSGEKGVEKAKELMKIARKSGINCFDHAEAYGVPNGEAERIFGIALSQLMEEDNSLWRRSELIITTKIYWGGEGVNEKGLSRKHINEGIKKSLTRLQLDYVDLIFCHRPDPLTPTSTVVRAMTEVVRNGKATAWGTSEWSAQQITEAYWIAKSEGLEPPQIEQPQYNMLHRDRFEREYYPLFKSPYSIGTTIWEMYDWLRDELERRTENGEVDIVKRLTKYAKSELGCSTTQLALAWCLKNPNVSTILLGATNSEQMIENIGSIEVAKKLTKSNMEEIDQILGNSPEMWWGPGGDGPAGRILESLE